MFKKYICEQHEENSEITDTYKREAKELEKTVYGDNPSGITPSPPAKTWSSAYLRDSPCYLAHFQAPLSHFQCLVCTQYV